MFREAERFAINILAEDQIDLSNRFARGGADKFSGVKVRTGLGGIPLIEGATAYIECVREACYPGGDHSVFLGRVDSFWHQGRSPLVFGGGRYMAAAPHESTLDGPSGDDPALDQIKAVRLAGPVARSLAHEAGGSVAIGVWGDQGPTTVRWEESLDPVSLNLRVGMLLPVLESATGLALAAHLPLIQIAPLIRQELNRADEPSTSIPRDAEEKLAAVRAEGSARVASNPRFAQLYGVAVEAIGVPVLGRQGTALAALTLVFREGDDRAKVNRGVEALKKAASQLSRRLGYAGT